MKIKGLMKTRLSNKKFVYFLWDDIYIGQRIALGKYEPYETKLAQVAVKDGVVVDVGANIGYYTLVLADKAKKIYAIEPEETNFALLEKNLKINRIGNVAAIKAAATDKEGWMELVKSEENYGDHRIVRSKSLKVQKSESRKIERYKVGSQIVRTVRLDEAVKEKVKLLKIDVQGWEPAVIEGTKELIARDRPMILMEYWPKEYRKNGLDYRGMIRFLERVYGKIYEIDDGLATWRRVRDWGKLEEDQRDLVIGPRNWWLKYRYFRVKKWIKGKLNKG